MAKTFDYRDYDSVEVVREFIETFNVSRDPALWAKLAREEFAELMEAMFSMAVNGTEEDAAHLLKEAADLVYVVAGMEITDAYSLISDGEAKTMFETMQAVCEMFPVEMRGKAFLAVHASNMSKLGADGQPIRREDGKILKGPNYVEPDMVTIIREFFTNLEEEMSA